MTATASGRAQIERLRSAVTGRVYEAGDPALEAETMGANLTFAHTPAVAVGAETGGDVAATVRFAAWRNSRLRSSRVRAGAITIRSVFSASSSRGWRVAPSASI
jgi:hypothetical protein